MLTICNSYVLWLLRCVQLCLVTVTLSDVYITWCYVAVPLWTCLPFSILCCPWTWLIYSGLSCPCRVVLHQPLLPLTMSVLLQSELSVDVFGLQQSVLSLDLPLLQQAVLPCMFLSYSWVSAIPSRVCVSVQHQSVFAYNILCFNWTVCLME